MVALVIVEAAQSPMKKLTTIVTVIFVGFVVWAVHPRMKWDGGFPQLEYQIQFIDSASGKPEQNLVMTVQNPKGEPAAHYSVLQYDGINPISPDEKGVFTFHQIRSGLQFGGTCKEIFGIIPVGRCKAPQFVCNFFTDGELIHTKTFNNLDDSFDSDTALKSRRQFTVRETARPRRIIEELPEDALNEIALDYEFPVVKRVFQEDR